MNDYDRISIEKYEEKIENILYIEEKTILEEK
jgi:hypothetical protein